jgi:ATP-binding cassette subfamily C protein
MGGKLGFALLLMVCLSLMEGIGLLMLVPLLQLVGMEVQHGALGRIAEFISSIFKAVGVHPNLIIVLGAYVLITGIHALLRRWETTANLTIHHEFVVRLRQRVYQKIARANWLFFVRTKGSDFTHVLTNEVERVGAATYQFLHLIAMCIVTCVYILLALKLSTVMTMFVFAFGGGLMLLLKNRAQIAREAGEDTSRVMNKLYAAITEHIGGMKTAKSHGAEDRHVKVFANLTERVHRTYIRAVRNQAEVKYWFDIGSVLILSLIVYVAFEILAVSTAELLMLLFLFARIMPRFSGLQQCYHEFTNLLPALSSVVDMQTRCEEAEEPWEQSDEEVKLSEGLQLECVTFAYEETSVVKDVSLIIRGGKTTALVGPSGAGKTTVADLIIGLVKPQKGQILVDGNPLKARQMRGWREQIGYVAQDPFLFHDTLRANLLWAHPDATEKEIWGALKLAAAAGFVSELPKGLDTVVGDRGVRLSGGERQRLALARALLRKPSLLILDEATSNLDSENEKHILRAIAALHGSTTILIISHRLSTVRGADVIYVLDKGGLVESASWETLLASEHGHFRAMCQAQGIV